MEKEKNKIVEYVRVICGRQNGKNKTNGCWSGWSWDCDIREGNSNSDEDLKGFWKREKKYLKFY